MPRLTHLPPVFLALSLLGAPLLPQLHADVAAGTSLLMLKNDVVEAGILPAAAGRVVLFQRPGGQNILKADPAIWTKTAKDYPPLEKWNTEISPDGQVHWTGPQANFWNQQTQFPDRENKMWPPDPWSEIAEYAVTVKTPTMLILKGPVSPVSGLSFTKTYQLAADGAFTLTVTAKNERAEPVRWDLWSVTRVSPYYPAFTVVAKNYAPMLLEGGTSEKSPPIPWKVKDDIFSLFQEIPMPEGVTFRSRKALLYPPPGQAAIAYLRDNELFLKRFTPAAPEECAPGHTPIEIYLEHRANGGGVQELEFHGPYKTLQPGDTMSITETWELRTLDTHAKTREDWLRIAREVLNP